jgi:hypothetical protein
MAENAEQLARKQLKADAIKGGLKVPHFSGEDDTMTVKQFFTRFERAVESAGFPDEAMKCQTISTYLAGIAATAYENGITAGWFKKDDWNTIKTFFFEKYQGQVQHHDAIISFETLKQKPTEAVNKFYFRVMDMTIQWSTLVEIEDDEYPDGYVAGNAAPLRASVDQMFKRKIIDSLGKSLFIAGLKDSLRGEVQRAEPKNANDACNIALKLEATEVTKKGSRIHELGEWSDESLSQIVDELTEEDINWINNYRGQKGRQPFKRFKKNNGGKKSNSSGNNESKRCRHCKKFGHMQKVCKTRLAKGAPMVDENGKPYKSINDVKPEDDEEEGDIQGLFVNSLN